MPTPLKTVPPIERRAPSASADMADWLLAAHDVLAARDWELSTPALYTLAALSLAQGLPAFGSPAGLYRNEQAPAGHWDSGFRLLRRMLSAGDPASLDGLRIRLITAEGPFALWQVAQGEHRPGSNLRRYLAALQQYASALNFGTRSQALVCYETVTVIMSDAHDALPRIRDCLTSTATQRLPAGTWQPQDAWLARPTFLAAAELLKRITCPELLPALAPLDEQLHRLRLRRGK